MAVRKIYFSLLALCLSLSCLAQFTTDDIKAKFENYQSQSSRQILHLRLNQPEYTVRDTIFFKAFLTEEDRRLSTGKHIATADLYGSAGLVTSIKYEIKEGAGYNQIVLPADLLPGRYSLVSYTNWMKNFDTDYMFQKEIQIVDQFETRYAKNEIMKVAIEGGNLVSGVSTDLAIKTRFPNAQLQLLANQEVIATIMTDFAGLGGLNFEPQMGVNYTLVLSDSEVNQALPQVSDSQNTIRVERVTADVLSIVIPSRGTPKEGFVVMTNRGKILYTEKLTLNASSSDISREVTLNSDVRGRIGVYLLDSQGTTHSFTNTFLRKEYLNQPVVSVQPSQTRQKVDLGSISEFQETGIPNSFYMSVYNAKLFQNEGINLLQDELDYFADAPYEHIIDESDEDWPQHLKWYLTLTAQSPNWSEILYRDTHTRVHLKDNMVRRIAYARDSLGKPLERGSRIMMYFHKEYIRLEGLTGRDGKIRLHFPGIESESQMYYSAMDRKGEAIKGVQLEWIPEQDMKITLPGASVETELTSDYGKFAADRDFIRTSYAFFGKEADKMDTLSFNFMDDFEKNVIRSDDVFKTVDYEIFPTMKQYINEVVSPLQVYNSFGRTVLRVKSLRGGIEDEPLIIVDGVGSKNLKYLLSLNPKDIEEIRIIRTPDRLNLFSSMGRSGIVLIKSYEGNLAERLPDNNTIIGINSPVNKRNIQNTDDKGIPVFDANIFWQPELNISQSLSFTQSNDIGQMVLLLEGFVDGNPVTYTVSYKSSTQEGLR